jgi:hypothetical protein
VTAGDWFGFAGRPLEREEAVVDELLFCPACGRGEGALHRPTCADAGRVVMATALPRARSTDPPTSHAAAASAAPLTGRVRIEVLRALRAAGSDGLTDEELVARLSHVATPSGVRTRRAELTERGWVHDSGLQRLTRSRRRAIVWVVKDL